MIGTLGTSMSLILAGAVGLFAVSTIVAFNHWPGVGNSASPQSNAILAQQVAASAALHRDLSELRSSRAHEARATGASASALVTNSAPTQSHVPHPTGRPAHAPAPAAPVRSQLTPKLPSAGEGVQQLGAGVADTVGKTGKDLSGVVRPLSPQLADTVEGVTNSVGATVRNLGGAVAELIDQLLGKPAG